MLFNSFEFIFLYLPVVFAGFFLIGRINIRCAAAWLAVASVVFYGYWNPKYVALLIGSIALNYLAGRTVAVRIAQGRKRTALSFLAAGITADLLILGYFKYAGFFLESFGQLFHSGIAVAIVLPLGISFFTFTQIAYLVDAYRGRVTQYDPIHYALFVSYFPHLIAGPILHHHEMIPQFERPSTYRLIYRNLSVGLTIFVIGLFKKVILADGIGPHVGPIFDAAAAGTRLGFVEAWSGSICYALQLYFDFSGYSDMAIGLSRLFGIVLPLNFFSPYKSVNIIEFWRRWHMTLSRFLRDYLYFPLGGNRKGKSRRYVNLMVTMLLGGLWHGAGWAFVVWGGLHGLYLVLNHGWQGLRRKFGQDPDTPLTMPMHAVSVLVTFLAVSFAWAFFRAHDLSSGLAMAAAMAGANGFAPVGNSLVEPVTGLWIAILMLVVWFAPNLAEIMYPYRAALDVPKSAGAWSWLVWRPSFATTALVWLIALIAIANLNKHSAFLYFQF